MTQTSHQNAIVTGAAGGLGRAIPRALAELMILPVNRY
jgi:NAD(P)-dependent dehydrogenase (short-subunit alcohol dehydrogenase family)